MKVSTVTITPNIALEMLKLNHSNRTTNEEHIRMLAREMSLGRWKLNGDAIRINKERLVDGQHRLLAVIKSGVSIETLLIEDISSDVFDTIDIGKKRTAADTLTVRGEKNAKNIAGALAYVDKYQSDRMHLCVRFTNTEIESLLEKNPGIRRSVRVCPPTKKLLSPCLIMACHYLFSRHDESLADDFVNRLISGVGLDVGDPILVLRNRLIQNGKSKAKLPNTYIMAITIKAWNLFRLKKHVTCLKFSEEGRNKEQFPVVK